MRRRLSILAVPAVAVAVSAVTILNRVGVVSLRDLASTPQGVTDGREWQLLTSAFVADRPAVPSVIGFAIVGLAALALAGARILWTAAVAGHLLSTVVVYGALDAAGVTVSRLDYGTSAIIAAWVGVCAYCLWKRGAPVAAVGLCLVAALVGWVLSPNLDVLDSEHAVALAIGIGIGIWLPKLGRVQLRVLARHRLLLHAGLLRLGSARRNG